MPTIISGGNGVVVGDGPPSSDASEGTRYWDRTGLSLSIFSDGAWHAVGGGGGGPHAHAMTDVTGLVSALAAKSDAAHAHTALMPQGGSSGQVLAKTSAVDFAAAWQSPAGGSDPWSIVVLGSPFSTTSASNVSVTGLAFTPLANTRYLVSIFLLLRTATATVGPRPGIAWPSGLTDGGARLDAPNSATAFASRSWGPLNTQNAASTGVPDTTSSHLASGDAYMVVGASPSGQFQVTLASETAGTSVTVRAGSFLAYRTIA